MPTRLVVFGCGFVLASLVVELREDHVRDLRLPVAFENARGGGQVSVQVGLDGRRATAEEDVIPASEVDLHADWLEGRDVELVLRHAIAASDDQNVGSARQRNANRGSARIAQRTRSAANCDERVCHGTAFPDEIHVERALTRVKVEIEALGAAATDSHLLLDEVGGEDLLATEGW